MMTRAQQTIVPHLWFEKGAKEAAEFYVRAFGGDSQVNSVATLSDTPSGVVDVATFRLLGYDLMAIGAGPQFKLNPSISFFVNFDPSQRDDAREALDALWVKLSEGGKVLMPLEKYPFSERYGWIEDKYGLSWQLILRNPEDDERPAIVPSFLFVGDVCGKAEEATDFYLSIFENARRGEIARYPAGMEPDQEGSIMFTDFVLAGQWFAAMDSAQDHQFHFNEALSLLVNCNTQEEIDYYWEKLSAVPEAEQCGWLKDKYGIAWQIVPRVMGELMSNGTPAQSQRVTQAFMQMKKLVVADLQKAFDGG